MRDAAYYVELSGSPATLGSDASYLRFYGRAERVWPIHGPWYFRGRAELGTSWVDDFSELPVSLVHADRVAELPAHHADPFDRLLIAQAQLEGATLVTHDRAIEQLVVSDLAERTCPLIRYDTGDLVRREANVRKRTADVDLEFHEAEDDVDHETWLRIRRERVHQGIHLRFSVRGAQRDAIALM